MTPERQEWWDNLPQKEKELREAIAEHEKWIKINKSYLPDGSSDIEYVKKMLRRQKLITKALKHELERGGRADMSAVKGIGPNKVNVYFCSGCSHIIYADNGAPDYCYCPYCGTKLSDEVRVWNGVKYKIERIVPLSTRWCDPKTVGRKLKKARAKAKSKGEK